MSAISRDEVAHLARLARLDLGGAELDHFAGQIDSILSHVRQIGGVDTAGVPPTAHPLDLGDKLRADVVTPGLTREQALSQAPKVELDRFAVPQILGEEQ